jgi:Pyridoxamine 5'-phosphate oxidase
VATGTVPTVRWDAFEHACPEIGELARNRFVKDELVMLGTIRPDGSARVSPCEVDFAAGRLILGMMWRSQKALDLLRDPRIAVHSVPSGRMNPGGDVKLYGRVVDEQDPAVRRAFHDEIMRRIDWAPEGDHHVFSLDVERAAYIRFGDDRMLLTWDPDAGLRTPPFPEED